MGDCAANREDWLYLKRRKLGEDGMSKKEQSRFENSIRIFFTNEEVAAYNKLRLEKLKRPICLIRARNVSSYGRKRTYHEDHFEQGLINHLTVCEGCTVMLRCNLFTEAGLVNGAIGIVEKIIFKKCCKPPDDVPEIILVKFRNYNGPTLDDGCVPISLVTKSWRDDGTIVTRTQFPLMLCFGITGHKCQGLTLDDAVVNLEKTEMSLGQTYVVCSRVRTIKDLAFEGKLDCSRITDLDKTKKGEVKEILKNRRLEEAYLFGMQNSEPGDAKLQKQFERDFQKKETEVGKRKNSGQSDKEPLPKKLKISKTTNDLPEGLPSAINSVNFQLVEIDKELTDESMIINDESVNLNVFPVVIDDSSDPPIPPNPFAHNANDYYMNKISSGVRSLGAQNCYIIENGMVTSDFELETYVIKRLMSLQLFEKVGLIKSGDFTVTGGANYLKDSHSSSFEKIFVLINHRNAHWLLGFIDLIAKRVLILDSLISSSDFYNDYKVKLFKVMKAVCNIDSRNLNFAKFKFCIPSGSPQQLSTSNDCGPFICNFKVANDSIH